MEVPKIEQSPDITEVRIQNTYFPSPQSEMEPDLNYRSGAGKQGTDFPE